MCTITSPRHAGHIPAGQRGSMLALADPNPHKHAASTQPPLLHIRCWDLEFLNQTSRRFPALPRRTDLNTHTCMHLENCFGSMGTLCWNRLSRTTSAPRSQPLADRIPQQPRPPPHSQRRVPPGDASTWTALGEPAPSPWTLALAGIRDGGGRSQHTPSPSPSAHILNINHS